MVLGLHNIEDIIPLGGSRVNTGWVVGANVQENDGVVLGILQIFLEPVDIESLGVWVVVTVAFPLLADDFDKTSVEWPC